MLLEIFNKLPLKKPVTADSISICHEIPTKRKDEKRVVVCKFIARKTKIDILNAKKIGKNLLKYYDNNIFLNEHLSPKNRKIFAAASQKRKILNYKYIWTRNGTTLLRKDEHSIPITIDDIGVLDSLTL